MVWAVRNDKFNCAGRSEKWVATHFPGAHDDDKADQDEDEETAEKVPVQPPPVRETGTPAKKSQSTLFS